MPGSASVRDPWSSGDLNLPTNPPLQWRRNTAAALAAQNPLLTTGEPAWEIDTSKGKVGNGTAQYNSLPYTLGGSASTLTLNAASIAGNPSGASGAAVSLDATAARALIEVPFLDDFVALEGGVDSHVDAVKAPSMAAHTAITSSASPTVSAGTPFPDEWTDGMPLYGPGVPKYTYVRAMAANRLSFTMSSSSTSTVAVNSIAGFGTGTFTVRNPLGVAHGAWLGNLWDGNPLSSVVTGYSGPDLATASLAPEKWMVQWVKGELWVKSNEYPAAERVFPSDPYTPILKHLIIPAIGAPHTWSSFPSTTPASFAGHYITTIPLEGATQAKVVVTWLVTAASAGSLATVKAQYNDGTAWVDLAENSPASLIQVAVNTGSLTTREGPWGTIDNVALSTAVANGDRLLIRIVGFGTSVPAQPPVFSQIELWTKP